MSDNDQVSTLPRSGEVLHTRPVVVGIDGSAKADVAAQWAAAYAEKNHSPVLLVHCVPEGDRYGSASFVDGGALERDLRAIGRTHLGRAKAEVRTIAPEVPVETVVADGSIGSFVSRTDAELLVLGSKKPNLLQELALGSDTLRVVQHAHCPVLLLRGGHASIGTGLPIVVGIDGSEQSDRALEVAFEMARTLGMRLIRPTSGVSSSRPVRQQDSTASTGPRREPTNSSGSRCGWHPCTRNSPMWI